MNLIDVFRIAYEMENRGKEFYTLQRELVKSRFIEEIFGFLAQMEEGHAEYIKRQMDNIDAGKAIESPPEDMPEDLFSERLQQQKIEPGNLKEDLGDFSIIRMAYLIEKDFAEFYQKSADNQTGTVKHVFLQLCEWETEHARLMKEQLEAIIARNSLDLGFYPL